MLNKSIFSLAAALSLFLLSATFANAGFGDKLPNAKCTNGELVIYMDPQNVNSRKALRIDDTSNGWNDKVKNPGDVIDNNVLQPSYTYKNAKTSTEYVWWFHRVDANGNYSSAIVGTTYCGLPAPTELTGKYQYPNVNLSWKPVAGAKYYAIRVDNTATPWTGDKDKLNEGDHLLNQVSETSFKFKAAPGRNIIWWVHAVDAKGRYSDSAISSVYTTLEQPTGLVGKYNHPNVTLSWKPVEGAVSYQLRVDNTITPWNPENIQEGDHSRNNLQETTFAFKADWGRKINWWVHAVDRNGKTTNASVHTFWTY